MMMLITMVILRTIMILMMRGKNDEDKEDDIDKDGKLNTCGPL